MGNIWRGFIKIFAEITDKYNLSLEHSTIVVQTVKYIYAPRAHRNTCHWGRRALREKVCLRYRHDAGCQVICDKLINIYLRARKKYGREKES